MVGAAVINKGGFLDFEGDVPLTGLSWPADTEIANSGVGSYCDGRHGNLDIRHAMSLAGYRCNVKLSTVSYMPPEQAMGGDVTPQSDLYSLGAMLYEMVCGRPPFLGDDSVAIIGQHINTAPVAPTWHRQECPRALEALIMRLLAKDPGERPNSATDAITALEGLDLIVSADEPVAERDQARALDSLAGGVFVGRQREMGEL